MRTLVAALSIAIVSTFAWAGGPAFSDADANKDGVLTMEEAKAALPEMEETQIAAADTNNDGALSEAEYTALTAG